MNITRRFLGAALAVGLASTAAVPALAQSATQSLSSESVIETIKKRGVIKIGLSLFKPWSMRDLNGDLIGYELDVGRQLAEDMGVEVEFIPTSWDGIIPALVANKYDAIIASMSITAEREKKDAFTNKYYNTPARFVAQKGSGISDTSPAGLKGKVIGAQSSTTHSTYLEDIYKGAEIKLYGT